MKASQPVNSTTQDPAMVTKGWLPVLAVAVVMLIALFSGGVSYGNHLRQGQVDIEMLSSSSFSMHMTDDVFPDSCDNVGVYFDMCTCILNDCGTLDVDLCDYKIVGDCITNNPPANKFID